MALLKRKRVGLNDAMEVVTKFVNACNRHDADGVAACLHPDFDSIQPMYPSRNFRGADQVRRNWQAIFDAEPGFRLTVLRSASTDDTVWLELHGAGRDAEVAGIFIMGVAGDRIRWARIYSALVEPVVAGAGEASDPAASLPEVRSADGVVEEDLIAPVLDMERSGRRRRRRRAEQEAAVGDSTTGDAVSTQVAAEVLDTPEEVLDTPEEVLDTPAAVLDTPAAVLDTPEVTDAPEEVLDPADAAGATEASSEPVDPVVEAVGVVENPEAEPVVVIEVEQAVERSVDGGPDTEAVPVVVWVDDPTPTADPEVVAVTVVSEPEPGGATEIPDAAADDLPPAPQPPPDSTKRRFGKRLRP